MTKRNCMVQETGIAIEALADALDQERRKPFNGDICDLLEWATKDVFAMRQQLAESKKKIMILRETLCSVSTSLPAWQQKKAMDTLAATEPNQ